MLSLKGKPVTKSMKSKKERIEKPVIGSNDIIAFDSRTSAIIPWNNTYYI